MMRIDMIYTVTLNPSLDYILKVDSFREGAVNRSMSETVMAGGKGINVSLVLHALGCETRALGFLAGFTGEEIAKKIKETGCEEDFIRLENGFSRINVKLKSGEETEINGAGPAVSSGDMEKFLAKLESCIEDGDTLVLSGSVPRTLDASVYCTLARSVAHKRIKLVADASGALLQEILACRPFLVKPNHHELGEMFGVCINTRKEAVFYAEKLREAGAANVLVSMAEKGAVLVTDGCVYEADAPKGTVVNSVGAGDSMVAGFLAGGEVFESALRLAVAAGSASAFSEGLATKADTEALLPFVYINGTRNDDLYK